MDYSSSFTSSGSKNKTPPSAGPASKKLTNASAEVPSTQVIGSKLTPEMACVGVTIHEWLDWVQQPNNR
jgi:hypothetical protein